MNGGDGDYHTPLILLSTYGSGRIYIVAIPDNYADIYRIPRGAADVLKRIVSTDVYASGRDFSLFAYDDGSMILYQKLWMVRMLLISLIQKLKKN